MYATILITDWLFRWKRTRWMTNHEIRMSFVQRYITDPPFNNDSAIRESYSSLQWRKFSHWGKMAIIFFLHLISFWGKAVVGREHWYRVVFTRWLTGSISVRWLSKSLGLYNNSLTNSFLGWMCCLTDIFSVLRSCKWALLGIPQTSLK